ncbi:hypothetical protein D9M68_813580 [compost metagenome]
MRHVLPLRHGFNRPAYFIENLVYSLPVLCLRAGGYSAHNNGYTDKAAFKKHISKISNCQNLGHKKSVATKGNTLRIMRNQKRL